MQEIHDYSVTEPFPIPNIDTVTVTKQPYYAAGLAVFATLTIGAAFEAARYARRSHEPVIRTDGRPPAARVGSLELFSPDVIPTRRGLGMRMTGRVVLPNRRF